MGRFGPFSDWASSGWIFILVCLVTWALWGVGPNVATAACAFMIALGAMLELVRRAVQEQTHELKAIRQLLELQSRLR
jgi:membrane-associated PAP2 superfamily phosphatase